MLPTERFATGTLPADDCRARDAPELFVALGRAARATAWHSECDNHGRMGGSGDKLAGKICRRCALRVGAPRWNTESMTMNARYTARVTHAPEEPKTKHYRGLPPQVAGGTDSRQPMESPGLLVIEQKPDGVFLFRFMADRRCVGDTWHESVDAAKRQAAFEFDDLLTAWRLVPDEVDDPILFGLAADA